MQELGMICHIIFFFLKICLKSVLFCIFQRCKGGQYLIFDGKHWALAILAPLRNLFLFPFHLTEDVTGCLVLTPGENYLRKATLHKQYQTELLSLSMIFLYLYKACLASLNQLLPNIPLNQSDKSENQETGFPGLFQPIRKLTEHNGIKRQRNFA